MSDKRNFLLSRKKKLERVRARLKRDFVGIDEIIDRVIDSIKVWYCVPQAITRPVIINLWGMTGVGKTDLVRKLTRYLDMSDKYVEVIMSSEGSENNSWNNTVQSILFDSDIMQGEPGIIMFDEIQKYRTKDETGKEISKKHFNDMWVLLSDGKFSSHGKRGQIETFLQRIFMHQYDEEKRMEREEQSLLDDDEDELVLTDEDVDELAKKILEDDSLVFDSEENARAELRKIKERRKKEKPKYREFSLSTWEAERFKKLLGLDMPLSKIVRLSESKVIDMLMDGARRPELLAEDDYSKLLIFISGNIDEAYTMSGDVEDSDSDADAVRAFTEKIDINFIKGCLMKRFRAEQIARFGNDHVVYKSLSKASYEEIIRRKINEAARDCSKATGVTVRIRKSVNRMVYDNGVYPTQGTRPVFSTISEVVSKSVPDAVMRATEKEVDKVVVGYNFKKRAFVCDVGDEKMVIPYVGSVDKIKDGVENCEDRKTLIAVHEAGHCLAYSVLFGVVPVQVSPVSAFKGGFVMQHTRMQSKEMMFNKIVVCMAGRAAELMVFGDKGASEGARSDMETATYTASAYCRKHGFFDDVGCHAPDNDYTYIQDSDKTDSHMITVIDTALRLARSIIDDNTEAFTALAVEFKKSRKIKEERIQEILKEKGVDAKIFDVKRELISRYSDCFDCFVEGRGAISTLVAGASCVITPPSPPKPPMVAMDCKHTGERK